MRANVQLRTRLAATIVAALALASPALAANAITGVWDTGSKGGRVQIYPCGANLCGKVVDAAQLRTNPDLRDTLNSDPKLRTRRLMNLVVLEGFTGGPTQWKGGPVYDPETGQGAGTGYLKLLPDGTLQLKGCIAGFLCRTKVWTRAR